jgi:uncharacterized protein YgiM (DUF1202 family)
MKKYLPLLALVLFTLACSLTAQLSASPTPPALASPAPDPAPSQGKPAPAWTASPTPPGVYIVTAHAVNLRACPGLDCVILDTLTQGQAVTVLDTLPAPDGGTWTNVTTLTGRSGWINSKYIQPEESKR